MKTSKIVSALVILLATSRHLVAGIWDEGGWDKYGGRRQIALFGGLFGSKGVIGHISATGASSYPQSTISGSQYARCRAIDGRGFDNGQWVSMAMTFDPAAEMVTVFCDGVATPIRITDPVAEDVFRHKEPVASNPYRFPWPIYSSRSFVCPDCRPYNIRVVEGDLLDQEVDVIVNSWNRNIIPWRLLLPQGVSGAAHVP